MNPSFILLYTAVLVAGTTPGPDPGMPPAASGGAYGSTSALQRGGDAAVRSALAGYDFRTGEVRSVELPRRLREVSGLAVDARGMLFAHDDERGTVHVLSAEDGEVVASFELGSEDVRGDFEGIALAGSRVFLVTSEGSIVESAVGADGESVAYDVTRTDTRSRCGEIEGLEYDAPGNALLLACKTTVGRELRGQLVVLRFSLRSRTLDAEPFLSVPLDALEAFDLDDALRPSGIAIHPVTGTILVISARPLAIIELDRTGRVLDAAALRGRHHEQPEGIAFTRDGTLVIADEGGSGDGTLAFYPWRAAGAAR